ncbi:hypothetical protein, partial [Klebsiella variicola]|uniref:hypothetical protein n=1 Tax=Klebsiella variicola TaxID=244366 RepID=UPI001954580F
IILFCPKNLILEKNSGISKKHETNARDKSYGPGNIYNWTTHRHNAMRSLNLAGRNINATPPIPPIINIEISNIKLPWN